MTQNVRDFYAELRRQESQLTEPFYFMMSLEDKRHGYHGGVVVEVTRANAAQLLTKRSHRIATPEEVEAWKAHEEERRKESAQTEYQRILNANPLLQQAEAARSQLDKTNPAKPGKEK